MKIQAIMFSIISFHLVACGDLPTNESWRTTDGSAASIQGAAIVAGRSAVKRRDVTYTGADGNSYAAAVFEPETTGEHALFIWIPGTGDRFDTPVALHIARTMAERGVVGVTIGYNNKWVEPASCEIFDKKAQAVFDRKSKNSLINVLEQSTPGLSLKKGLVVGGHSQGASVSGRAKMFLSETRAAWLLGTGTTAWNGALNTCIEATRATAIKNIRAVNGEYDIFFGDAATSRANLQRVTGRGLDSLKLSFFDSTGSGYHVVTFRELGSFPDHSYFQDANHGPRAAWDTTSQPWGRRANQDFLLKNLTP